MALKVLYDNKISNLKSEKCVIKAIVLAKALNKESELPEWITEFIDDH
jgi:hypothetical protein